MNIREELAEALHQLWNDRVDHGGKVCPSCLEDVDDSLLPIVWRFAAEELRLAADDGARQRVGIPRTWGWLRDRAGTMDGGERR